MHRFPILAVIVAACLIRGTPLRAQEVVILEKPVRVATSSGAEMFPESWRGVPVAAEGRALPAGEVERARAIFAAGLAKYPPGVLAANLKGVYALAELRYRGVTTSGTNSRTTVYVKLGSEKAGFTAAQIEGTFHAEFSSILLRNHPDFLDTAAWQAVNPEGFHYLGDGVEAVKRGKAGLKVQEALLAEGFLVEYGRSTLENDFNGVALRLFLGDAELWALAAKYPKIRRKLDLALAFYQRLDPAFTEAFFRGLGKAGEGAKR